MRLLYWDEWTRPETSHCVGGDYLLCCLVDDVLRLFSTYTSNIVEIFNNEKEASNRIEYLPLHSTLLTQNGIHCNVDHFQRSKHYVVFI